MAPPVGVRQHAGDDVGDKGGADEQEDVLDPVEAAPEHHEPDEHRGARHRQVARDPRKLEAGCNPGELGGRGAEVRDDQAPRDDERRQLPPAPDTDERDQAGSRGKAKPCAELVDDHQRRDGEDKYPQELVAVTGAEDRIRRDSRRIVVRQARQEPRAEHGQERGQPEPACDGSERRPSMTSPQLLDERVEHALYLSRRLGDYGKPAIGAGRSRSKLADPPDATKRPSPRLREKVEAYARSPGATEGDGHAEGIRDRWSRRSGRADRVWHRRDRHGLQRPFDGPRQPEARADRRLARHDPGGDQGRGEEGGPAGPHQLPDASPSPGSRSTPATGPAHSPATCESTRSRPPVA